MVRGEVRREMRGQRRFWRLVRRGIGRRLRRGRDVLGAEGEELNGLMVAVLVPRPAGREERWAELEK